MLFLFIYSALRGAQKGFNFFSFFLMLMCFWSTWNCSLARTNPALLHSDFPECNKPRLGGDRASKHWPVDWYYSPSSALWFIGPTPHCKSLRKIRKHRSLAVGYTVYVFTASLWHIDWILGREKPWLHCVSAPHLSYIPPIQEKQIRDALEISCIWNPFSHYSANFLQ